MYFTVNLPSRELTHPTPWEKDNHLQGCVLVRGYVASQESSVFHQLERCSKNLGEIPWNADCFVHRAPYFMAYSTNNSYIIFPKINSSESWLKKYLSSIYHPYFFTAYDSHLFETPYFGHGSICSPFPFGGAIFRGSPAVCFQGSYMFTSHFSPLLSI